MVLGWEIFKEHGSFEIIGLNYSSGGISIPIFKTQKRLNINKPMVHLACSVSPKVDNCEITVSNLKNW